MFNTLISITPRDFYVALQVIGIVILLGELLYVLFQKPSEIQKHLIVILITLTISMVGYYIELIAQKEETAFMGICIGYLGKPFALFSFLLLIFEYTNIKIKKPFTLTVLIFFIALSAIVFTNDLHHLYYKDLSFDLENIASPISINGRGPFWYVYMVSSFIIFGSFIALTIYEFKRSRNKQAKQMAVLLFLVVFFSMLGLILFIADVTYNYDTTLFGILVGSIFLLILLTKYRLFSSLTKAQERTFEESDNGYIILDARMQISFYNKTAKKIVPELAFRGFKNEEKTITKLFSYKDRQQVIFDGKVYKVNVSPTVVGRNEKIVGITIGFMEITEHHYYKEKLSHDIKEATARIVEIQREAMVSFANVVEARDGNTGEHIKNVADVAKRIALALSYKEKYAKQIDSRYISMLEECAPLHDIGKIYIPDAILLKKGKLTPKERTIMQTHTEKGCTMIETALGEIETPDFLRVAKEIALSHHEWFDGSGYPQGLKGKKIPLSARIVAVADVYDALRMDRPYKKSISKNDSIAMIVQERGTHFDPDVVDAFLEIREQLK